LDRQTLLELVEGAFPSKTFDWEKVAQAQGYPAMRH